MRYISSLLTAGGLVFAAICLRQIDRDVETQQFSPQRSAPELLRIRLKAADDASQNSIDTQIEYLRDFFSKANSGTEPFAEAALGLSSKVRLVVDAIPYTKGDRHKRFLRKQFEQHIFSERELKEALEHLVQNYVRTLQEIDNQLLVQLRIDIEDFPSLQAKQLPELSFEPLIAKTIAHTRQSIPGDVTRETISLVTAGILARVAARLGLSAGILGTGAASSATTFGLSILAALIIDHLVSRLWDEFADPHGKLARELQASLADAFKSLDVAISAELNSLAEDRAQIRRLTLQPLLR